MCVDVEENIIRVVILAVNGIYAQIYDEVYCTKEKYNRLLSEYGDSDAYKVIVI